LQKVFNIFNNIKGREDRERASKIAITKNIEKLKRINS
jgi:hypothetical protein